MADVQLLDFRNSRHRADVGECQAMAGVNGEAQRRRQFGGAHESLERGRIPGMVCITTGVQLDGINAKIARSPDGIGLRIDEETDANASGPEPLDRPGKPPGIMGDIQSAFRRDFLASLGDDGRLTRPEPFGAIHDRIAQCHLEVERGGDGGREPLHVGILDVAPILTKVCRDAIGTRALANECRCHRIWFVSASCLTNRVHVIDVDE